MKGNAVYKRSYNGCLTLFSDLAAGAEIASESELAQSLAVSRTTIRSVLGGLERAGIVLRDGGPRVLARAPVPEDFFPNPQTLSTSATVERRFMAWILEGRIGPGQLLTSADLARQFGTSTTTIREHLPHLQHYGLIERRPNSAWLFKGVTSAFADEIYEVREMFELRAARRFVALDEDAEPKRRLRAIEREHRAMLDSIDDTFRGFPDLDERLHRAVHEAAGNRFIVDFYDVVSMLFHYNFRWDVDDEKRRALIALAEHLDYIDALNRRDLAAIDRTCRKHLKTGHSNLLRSIELRKDLRIEEHPAAGSRHDAG